MHNGLFVSTSHVDLRKIFQSLTFHPSRRNRGYNEASPELSRAFERNKLSERNLSVCWGEADSIGSLTDSAYSFLRQEACWRTFSDDAQSLGTNINIYLDTISGFPDGWCHTHPRAVICAHRLGVRGNPP